MRYGEHKSIYGRDDKYKLNVFDPIAYRREVVKMVSVANKRIKRLEEKGLQDSPAYKALFNNNGEPHFSVKGKTHNEVQQEAARLRKFLRSQTSTIRGINQNLKDIAANTGIKYKNLAELKAQTNKFFELVSKVQQYLRLTQDAASSIGYQKLWKAINTYVQEGDIDLAESTVTVDKVMEDVDKILQLAVKRKMHHMDGLDGEQYIE